MKRIEKKNRCYLSLSEVLKSMRDIRPVPIRGCEGRKGSLLGGG